MCGIVGLSLRHEPTTARTAADIKDLGDTFTSMLENAQARGSSATGLIMSYYDRALKKNKISVIRAPLPAREFVKTKAYKDVFAKFGNDVHFLIGHTRAPTGSAPPSNNINNHPHRVGKIIGVHNGHISNFNKLWSSKMLQGIEPKSECDSEVIFALIDYYRRQGKNNSEATAAAIKDIEGWFAFAYIDLEEPTTLWIARDDSDSAPIECCWMPAQRAALFASEEEFFTSAGVKAGFHIDTMKLMVFDKSSIMGINSFVKTNPPNMVANISNVDVNTKTVWTEEEKKLEKITRGL